MTRRSPWLLVLPLFAFLPKASGQGAPLSYFTNPTGASPCCTAADNAGNLFLVYSTPSPALATPNENEYGVSVIKLDSNFHTEATVSATVPFPPWTAAVDSNDNLWLAGSKTMVRLSSSSPALFVDLGGKDTNGATTALALAIDPAGNVYVTGTTTQSDFPVTSGAFQGFPNITIPPGAQGNYAFGFVSKYSSNGTRILSTLVRGVQTNCSSSTPCPPFTEPVALAVDAGGTVTISGETNTTDFPVTPNAPQTVCPCSNSSLFITRLNAGFSALVWSTFLGGTSVGVQNATVSAIALEPDGGVVVAGATDEIDFPTTSGAIEPAWPAGASTDFPHSFVTRLNSSGTAWVFSTYLVGSGADVIYGMQIDSMGNIWLAGNTTSPDFPAVAGMLNLGTDFLQELVADGSRLQFSEHLPAGAAGIGLLMNADGTFTVVGPPPYVFSPERPTPASPSVSLLRLPAGPLQGMSILGVVNSAAAQTAGVVAPGEFLSLYGTGLGPADPIGAEFDSTGRIASELRGVTVLFDGQEAPLLFVSANQINVMVPYEIATSAQTTFQVTTSAGPSQTLTLTVVPAQPGIFAVVNADGTVNGPANPAVIGSILTMYAGGAGVLNPNLPDGSIAGNPAPAPVATISIADLGGYCTLPGLPVLYSGGSPGLVVNALQVNFQFQAPQPNPPCSVTPYIQLAVGNAWSDPYQIYY